MKRFVGVGMNSLYSRRIIDVGHRRDFSSWDIEAIDTKQLVVVRVAGQPTLVQDVSNNLHVGAFAVELEPVGYVLAQHSRRKWAEAFAEFDPQIERALHGG